MGGKFHPRISEAESRRRDGDARGEQRVCGSPSAYDTTPGASTRNALRARIECVRYVRICICLINVCMYIYIYMCTHMWEYTPISMYKYIYI